LTASAAPAPAKPKRKSPPPRVTPEITPAVPPGSPLALAGRFFAELRAVGMADGFNAEQLTRRALIDRAVGNATLGFLGTLDERQLHRGLSRRLGLEAEGRRLEQFPDGLGFRLVGRRRQKVPHTAKQGLAVPRLGGTLRAG